MKYTYTEHRAKTWPNVDHNLVFECEAENILEADELLLEATGLVAAKLFNVGCNWEDRA